MVSKKVLLIPLSIVTIYLIIAAIAQFLVIPKIKSQAQEQELQGDYSKAISLYQQAQTLSVWTNLCKSCENRSEKIEIPVQNLLSRDQMELRQRRINGYVIAIYPEEGYKDSVLDAVFKLIDTSFLGGEIRVFPYIKDSNNHMVFGVSVVNAEIKDSFLLSAKNIPHISDIKASPIK